MRDYPDAAFAMAGVRAEGHAKRGQGWQLDTQNKPATYRTTKWQDPFSAYADLGSPA
jgi:hypothetical protein